MRPWPFRRGDAALSLDRDARLSLPPLGFPVSPLAYRNLFGYSGGFDRSQIVFSIRVARAALALGVPVVGRSPRVRLYRCNTFLQPELLGFGQV